MRLTNLTKDIPIHFCIPLIGQGAARNWSRVCELLEQTLASIQRGFDSEGEQGEFLQV